MGIGEFIKNVICAPYSIPVGIINSNVKVGIKRKRKYYYLEKVIAKEIE